VQLGRNQIIPIVIVLLAVVVALSFRPLLVLDETRYFSVAWEMFQNKNFLVPHLNGLPYDHKPPLLFWLTNLDWYLFGVNQTSVRLIPLFFAIGSMLLLWRIYRLLWPKDKIGADMLLWVVAGMLLFSFYSTLFMFDIMLGFWVLLAIYGGLKALEAPTVANFAIVAVAIGFGILAKSPVVIAHLLPIYLFAHTFGHPTKRFYIGGFIAVIVGIALALLWAIPAGLAGGEAYARGIFWGQYAGRAIDSFAHRRPFWWYLYWVPIILLPWIVTKPFWQGAKSILSKRPFDRGMHFLIAWLLGTLVIFSIISGKQLHYIVPEFGGYAMLVTRFFSQAKSNTIRAWGVGALFLLMGAVVLLAPFFIEGFLINYLDKTAFCISGILLSLFGLYFILKRFTEKLQFVSQLAWGSLVVIFVVHYLLHIYLNTQNLTRFSQTIKKLQTDGKIVAHYGKYHDQYQFLGRLEAPLKVIKDGKKLREYIKMHPEDGLIIYLKRDIPYNGNVVIDNGKLRTQNILLIEAKDYNKLF